jgi:hypothetical protein
VLHHPQDYKKYLTYLCVGSISAFSMVFHWLICLSFYQYQWFFQYHRFIIFQINPTSSLLCSFPRVICGILDHLISIHFCSFDCFCVFCDAEDWTRTHVHTPQVFSPDHHMNFRIILSIKNRKPDGPWEIRSERINILIMTFWTPD